MGSVLEAPEGRKVGVEETHTHSSTKKVAFTLCDSIRQKFPLDD